MTLSHKRVLKTLREEFECGWTNIKGRAAYAGTSNVHEPSFRAVKTTNCAGHHNVQMFFMTSTGEVVHCLPGYWEPQAFLSEVRLALALGKIHASTTLTRPQKYDKFLDLHLAHALEHSTSVRKNSGLQGFDVQVVKTDERGKDFRRRTGDLKTTDQVVHERMAERPFVQYSSFGVASYVAMGLKSFDSHRDGCHSRRARRRARPRAGARKSKQQVCD